jgi:serine/threonine-protein kinase PknG
MAEQLDGVRREVLAVDEQRPRPGPSAVFSAPRGTFAPSLLLPDTDTGPGRPAAALIAGRLPEPLDAGQVWHTDNAGQDDWRHRWSAALAAVAAGDLDTAHAAFDALYSTFPGELAPKLALAAVAECAADDDSAQRYYRLDTTVDPSWADAGFGLARTLLRAGRRAAAVSALLAVPTSSSGHVAARRAAVEATLLRHDAGSADDDELRKAAALLEQLALDPLTMQRMRVAVLDAAVERVGAGAGEPVLGCAWEERALRLELERSLRALARLTPDRAEKITLVDRANTAHPRTLR